MQKRRSEVIEKFYKIMTALQNDIPNKLSNINDKKQIKEITNIVERQLLSPFYANSVVINYLLDLYVRIVNTIYKNIENGSINGLGKKSMNIIYQLDDLSKTPNELKRTMLRLKKVIYEYSYSGNEERSIEIIYNTLSWSKEKAKGLII